MMDFLFMMESIKNKTLYQIDMDKNFRVVSNSARN
ncbi:hypothetical protein LLT5_14290 [Lactococcus cremoris subsp. cremoris TIFN5]|nr:hypothetical protein LLT5_14290 [Lactococcus cremoris subsp. cremoris TIFN5]